MHEGGNVGSASDILRWQGPVYRLGTYSDLDVKVSTKGQPKTLTVYGDLLLNVGTFFEDNRERLLCNNDIIAVLNSDSEQIKKAQQFLIKACNTPISPTSKRLSNLPVRLQGPWRQYNSDLTRLRAMYLGKTPRQWRANIPAFMQCLNELGEKISANEEAMSITVHSLDLIDLLLMARAKLEQDLYMDSVISSTGPQIVVDSFLLSGKFYASSVDYVLAAYSFAFYKPLPSIFSSTQSAFLRMNAAVRGAMRGGDFSWAKDGSAKMALRYQCTGIAEYLIAAGADLNAVTGAFEDYPNIKYPNKTALDLVMMYGNDPLAIQLVKAGAKSSPAVSGTSHTIHLAARNGSLHHVRMLLAQEPELINHVDCLNQTPLLWAASRGYHHIVAFLIAHHADINLATKQPNDHLHHHCSPLDWASRNGHIRTIILLLDAGAKANHPPVRIKNSLLVSAIKESS